MRSAAWILVGAGLFVASPARAGALGEVVKGLTRAAGGDGHKSGGGSGGGDVVSAIVNGLFSGPDLSSSRNASYDPTYVITPAYGPYPHASTGGQPTEVTIYAGVQSVEDSDGSMTLELRATYDAFGVVVRGTGFYETNVVGSETEYLHLDLGTIGAMYRAVDDGPLRLWLEGGLGGVSTVDGLPFLGLWGGLHVERKLQGELAVSAEARHLLLEDDVSANELRGTAHLSVLRVSYRVVDFNVGPPLQGPEVGIALMF